MVLPLPEVRATLYHDAHMKNLMDAKIDAYIAMNPKHWRGIQAMTREHLERTLVALYVQRQEAHERTRRKLPNITTETTEPAPATGAQTEMTTKTTTPIGPKCTCCNGKGQLPGNRPADAWVKCKPCGGLGRVLGPTVDESNVTEVSPANFCAEASELRLPPGAAPAQLATSLGNRCDFLLCAVSPDSLLYKQGNGCAQLRIFND